MKIENTKTQETATDTSSGIGTILAECGEALVSRARSCSRLAAGVEHSGARSRLLGKEAAYMHSAELLADAMERVISQLGPDS